MFAPLNVLRQGIADAFTYTDKPSAMIFPRPIRRSTTSVEGHERSSRCDAAMSDTPQLQRRCRRRQRSHGSSWPRSALPLVAAVLGYWFNASNERHQWTEHPPVYRDAGTARGSDSSLRKDMLIRRRS